MSLVELLRIELKKVKRSKILPLLLIPPLLVVVSGVSSISMYMTPEYTNSWEAMFIQSALLFGYYLLPFSMVVVCVMTASRETQNNGILKMLALPVAREKLAFAKFLVLLGFLAVELLMFFGAFVVAGAIATHIIGIAEGVPVVYLAAWTVKLFLTMIPCMACMWAITVFFEKALITVGLNLLLIIPGVLAANTSAWVVYPYCYSGYIVTNEMVAVTASQGAAAGFPLFPFLPCALAVTAAALFIGIKSFGRKEMR